MTAPVFVNNRFQVLATHADTSNVCPSTVSVGYMQCCDVPRSSKNDNISLSSQPNAVTSPHLLDFKANVDVSESTYSNTAIPLHVWENRFQCVDYQCCTQQNGFEFGAAPLTPIKLYEGKQIGNQPILDSATQHFTSVKLSQFLGCRIPVQTQLKPGAWRYCLQDYWDQQLPDLIEYGFNIDIDRSCPLVSTEVSHASSHEYGSDIETYLKEEVAFNAMYGPFQEKPINMHISSMMIREKQGLDNRRTIVDLSWPHGCSMMLFNDGVYKKRYLDLYYLSLLSFYR